MSLQLIARLDDAAWTAVAVDGGPAAVGARLDRAGITAALFDAGRAGPRTFEPLTLL